VTTPRCLPPLPSSSNSNNSSNISSSLTRRHLRPRPLRRWHPLRRLRRPWLRTWPH
jgi:hypothetical protein